VRVVGIGNQGCVTDDFAEGAAIRAEDGATASHRFDGRHAEALVKRGVNAGAGGVVERGQFRVAYKAEGADIVSERGLANGTVNGLSTGPILACENELPGGVGRAFELIEGVDEAHMIFSRMFEPRDVEEKGSTGFPMGARLLMSSMIGRRTEARVVQAIIDDADSVARNVEITEDVAGSIAADGDNGMLTVRQALDDDTAIKHAERIVLARDVKRGEVVDCGHGGAGARVEQTAIAWDVKDIKTVFADKARQECLMPQDVCDRMLKAFRDSDEFKSAIEFLEERQVAFEDKGREVMAARDCQRGAQQTENVLGNAGLPPLDDGGGNADVH